MPYESFTKLVSILQPALEQSNNKSVNSCGQLAISTPHTLGLTIHWCSGSSFHDICDAGNFSCPSFFRLLWKGISALIKCKRLQMMLPRTVEELEELQRGFESKSMEQFESKSMHGTRNVGMCGSIRWLVTDDTNTIKEGGLECATILLWPRSTHGVKCIGTCGL
jgi:hypothetical protein